MRILIVKASSLGDIIQAFPALGFLRKKFPDAEIDWVVEGRFAELVQAHPEVNRTLLIDSKKWRFGRRLDSFVAFRRALRCEHYDYVFDLQGNIKSGLVTFMARSMRKVGFGRKTVPEWPNLLATNQRINPPPGRNIREDYLALVQAPFGYKPAPVVLRATDAYTTNAEVMVCPGSAWESKRLREETLIDFCLRLQKAYDYTFLWVWGSEEEQGLAHRLKERIPQSHIAPKLSLPALQNAMSQMKCVIAADSLPLHLAGTTATPTFSFFGPSSPQKYRPLGNHGSIQGACPYKMQFEKRCPRLRRCHAPCMKNLKGEQLFRAYEDWIQPPPKTASSS